MSKPSSQLTDYFMRKGAKLEELADHHATIGEKAQAKDLYQQAKQMYARLADSTLLTRIDDKLKKLE